MNPVLALKPARPKPPEASTLKLAAELAGGVAGSLLGFFSVSSGSHARNCTPENDWEGGCSLLSMYYGALFGIPAGSIVGVYTIGSLGDTRGALWATALGTIAGMYFGLMVNPYLLVVFPPAGAVVGFNATLRYKKGWEPQTGWRALPYVKLENTVPQFGLMIPIQ
jgi:hypothetical protein